MTRYTGLVNSLRCASIAAKTMVIGGINVENKTQLIRRVPILGYIPDSVDLAVQKEGRLGRRARANGLHHADGCSSRAADDEKLLKRLSGPNRQGGRPKHETMRKIITTVIGGVTTSAIEGIRSRCDAPIFFDARFSACKGGPVQNSPGRSERSERNPGTGCSGILRALQGRSSSSFVRNALFFNKLDRPDRLAVTAERRPRGCRYASRASPWAAGNWRPFQGQDQKKTPWNVRGVWP